jgi:hypothetical protein
MRHPIVLIFVCSLAQPQAALMARSLPAPIDAVRPAPLGNSPIVSPGGSATVGSAPADSWMSAQLLALGAIEYAPATGGTSESGFFNPVEQQESARVPAEFGAQQSPIRTPQTETPGFGPSILANGDFASGLAGWTVGNDGRDWTVSNGKLLHSDPTKNNAISQMVNVVRGTSYVLGMGHPSGVAGSMEIQLGSVTTGMFVMAYFVDGQGYYLDGHVFAATVSGSVPFRIIPGKGNDVSLSSISLRPISSVAAAAYKFNNAEGAPLHELRYFGKSNLGEGSGNLHLNTTGANNVAIGTQALYLNTTGFDNTAVGVAALTKNTTGTWNTATGTNALSENTIGFYNTAFGEGALQHNTIGYNNTAIGPSALFSNTVGGNNTATGIQSLLNNIEGVNNTAIGVNALEANKSGEANTASGVNSLIANTTGHSNTGTGVSVLEVNTTGSYNTAMGMRTLQGNNGENNTAVGYEAGMNGKKASGNVFLGFRAGGEETGSNKLYIANDGTKKPLIGGDFSSKSLIINGVLQIASSGSPQAAALTQWVANDGATVLAKIASDGRLTTPGLTLTSTQQPACDVNTRGQFWYTAGKAGVKDSVAVCAKDAQDAFTWRSLF